MSAQGIDLVNQRIDLLKSNDAYVMYTRTGDDGRVTFDILPTVPHKVRSTYDDSTWISDAVTGPTEVHNVFE